MRERLYDDDMYNGECCTATAAALASRYDWNNDYDGGVGSGPYDDDEDLIGLTFVDESAIWNDPE
jgi:hypothetical protein